MLAIRQPPAAALHVLTLELSLLVPAQPAGVIETPAESTVISTNTKWRATDSTLLEPVRLVFLW